MKPNESLLPTDRISALILMVRGHRILLDRDLAVLYDVETKALNQAVRRNRDRFPSDFMFQLTAGEVAELNRSQIVTSSQKHRDPRFRPYAFSEQGVAMLSSVLRSKRAVAVNIEIVRVFVRLREMLASNHQLSQKLSELERHIAGHDKQIRAIFEAIRRLISPVKTSRRQIGFKTKVE
jgi:ORF6N domain-containing protein